MINLEELSLTELKDLAKENNKKRRFNWGIIANIKYWKWK